MTVDVSDFMDTLTVPPGTLNLKQLLSQAGETIVSVDNEWRVEYCNDIYARNVGLPRDQIIGRPVIEVQPRNASDWPRTCASSLPPAPCPHRGGPSLARHRPAR